MKYYHVFIHTVQSEVKGFFHFAFCFIHFRFQIPDSGMVAGGKPLTIKYKYVSSIIHKNRYGTIKPPTAARQELLITVFKQSYMHT